MCLINITYLINKQVYHPCAYLAFIFTTGNFPLQISNLPGLLKLQKNCLVVCPLFNCNSLAVWKLGRGTEGGIPTRKRENRFVGHFLVKEKQKNSIFTFILNRNTLLETFSSDLSLNSASSFVGRVLVYELVHCLFITSGTML